MSTSCGLGPCVFVFTVVPVCSAGAFSETNHMKRDGTVTCVVGQQIGINQYKYIAKELAHGGSLFGCDRILRERGGILRKGEREFTSYTAGTMQRLMPRTPPTNKEEMHLCEDSRNV